LWPFALALAAAGLSWWLLGRARGWVDSRSGEIGAWFIARLGWSDAQPFIRAAGWVLDWLRMLVVPFVALTWLAASVSAGPWAPAPDRRLRRALSPLRLLVATAVGVVFLWLPWVYGARWAPRGLPATWVEPAFAIAKFAAIALAAALGVTLLTRLAAPGGRP
jgi:hypothetical protein